MKLARAQLYMLNESIKDIHPLAQSSNLTPSLISKRKAK